MFAWKIMIIPRKRERGMQPTVNYCYVQSIVITHKEHYVLRHKEHYVDVSCGGVEVGPIPSNFILQKERPVCISIEGHGDHYVELNCGVVLLLCVESLMAGSTTGVPMSSCLYYTTKAPEFNSTTYAAPSHYTDAMKFYSALSYYTTKAT
ncbi:hypothetical protein DAPPUDRAFT_237655 [Daphnia pulex]|uniref:Uncharacterized protein n=1 Tax=Daphnia pulex TaxID=6669 RepID=E9G5H7_DAPPU|nr:hypothetical protein DAPPUDRAFT_237655 [Daphnia pulex]|eukprot:EFX85631.1 hypothetical protein DAPPUDRAFT_237655 [Daphnia pulex]